MVVIRRIVVFLSIVFSIVVCGCVSDGDLPPEIINGEILDIPAPNIVQNQENNSENYEPYENLETSSKISKPENKLVINCGAEVTNEFERDEYQSKITAGSTKIFLILYLTFENHGYDEINVNPDYFNIIVENIEYAPCYESRYLNSNLESVTLKNGENISGTLIFEVPEYESINYDINYKDSLKPNIEFRLSRTEINQGDYGVTKPLTEAVTKSLNEGEFSTHFESVELDNGILSIYFERKSILDEDEAIKEMRGILSETRNAIMDSSYEKPEHVFLKYDYMPFNQEPKVYSIELTWDEVYGIRTLTSSKFNEKLVIE
ncbi:hypothetical protein HNP87_001429 [Methanococcus maripaludis]|uniref:DUF4352 domain-containing protein n=1 Tax=Methanococcus maripaludis TaxID=39152 RepID=A0A7J9NJP5_METMI|nr:DUF4352 domain-containing protein [Methanococcus maripaludis]MBA2840897.1 hypothetical protein [Methanococcus maripaludis]